jgi:hypothetical protein
MPQASITTVEAGCSARKRENCFREKRWREAIAPGRREMATSNTDLATSTAIVVSCMRTPPLRGVPESRQRWHFDAEHVAGGVHLITAADEPQRVPIGAW